MSSTVSYSSDSGVIQYTTIPIINYTTSRDFKVQWILKVSATYVMVTSLFLRCKLGFSSSKLVELDGELRFSLMSRELEKDISPSMPCSSISIVSCTMAVGVDAILISSLVLRLMGHVMGGGHIPIFSVPNSSPPYILQTLKLSDYSTYVGELEESICLLRPTICTNITVRRCTGIPVQCLTEYRLIYR